MDASPLDPLTPDLLALIDFVPAEVRTQLITAAEAGTLAAVLHQVEQTLEMAQHARAGYKMRGYFLETGPYRRELYPQHMAFLADGLVHRERCFLAGNRVGKTDLGAYETVCHLTGLYPEWWPGRRFDHPIEAWAAGTTATSTKDIIQDKLLSDLKDPAKFGTGMLPKHTIKHYARKTHTPDAVEKIWVRHVSGGDSTLALKSYEQGRELFEGTAKHLIWLDEEPPQDIYTECLLRTMTTDGLIMTTFTPLKGRTPLVVAFLTAQATVAATNGVTRS